MVDQPAIAPIEVPESADRLTAIRKTFGDDIWDNSWPDIRRPMWALILYSLPAISAAVQIYSLDLPHITAVYWILSILLISAGIGLYDREVGQSGGQDRPKAGIYPASQVEYEWPWTVPPSLDFTDRSAFELGQHDVDILLTEYEQISEAVRYRDGLLNRTVYFGLAIIGVVGGTLAVVPNHFKPLVLLLLSLTMFLFAMATMKYKDARDLHWKRQRDLERLIPEFRGRLTVFHSNRTAKRRGLDKFSLTSSIVSIYLAFFMLTTGAYVVFTLALPLL